MCGANPRVLVESVEQERQNRSTSKRKKIRDEIEAERDSIGNY